MLAFNQSTTLSKDQLGQVRDFLNSFPLRTSIFQDPAWSDALYPGGGCRFIVGEDNNEVVFFAITEKLGWKYVNIQFGPVAHDPLVMGRGLTFIQKSFIGKALSLSWQPDDGMPQAAGNLQEPGYDWASITLDLRKGEQKLFESFSAHHRRAVRKGERLLEVKLVDQEDDVIELASLHSRMYRHRELALDENKNLALWLSMSGRFLTSGFSEGKIYGAYKDGRITGGIVVTWSGKRAFYNMGCSDPESRDVPVLHAAFWRAICDASQAGMWLFDFGGYNLTAAENSQLWHINRFKLGFGGEVVRYPGRRYRSLIPLGNYLLRTLRSLRSRTSALALLTIPLASGLTDLREAAEILSPTV